MLARSYSSMEKFAEAAGAYAKGHRTQAKRRQPLGRVRIRDCDGERRSLEGRPMELIDRALKVDPENAKALQLAGSAAFQAKDYKKAVDYWERVLKQVPPGSEVAQTLQGESTKRSRWRQLSKFMSRENLLFAIIGILLGSLSGSCLPVR